MVTLTDPMKAANILLIEDNAGDVLFAQKSFAKSKLINPLIVADSGESALEQLQNMLPDLILLDLHLPGINGQEVLQQIKNDPYTCRIPVLILTGSQAEMEIVQEGNLAASGYMIKPITLEKLFVATGAMDNFCITLNVRGN